MLGCPEPCRGNFAMPVLRSDNVTQSRCSIRNTERTPTEEVYWQSWRPSRSGAKAYPGKRRTVGLLNSPNWTSRESFSSVSIVIFLLRTSRRLLESRLGGVVASQKIWAANVRFGSKADIGTQSWNVRFVPKADSC